MSEALLQSLVVVQKQTNYSAAALGIQNELHNILKLSKNVSFWVCSICKVDLQITFRSTGLKLDKSIRAKTISLFSRYFSAIFLKMGCNVLQCTAIKRKSFIKIFYLQFLNLLHHDSVEYNSMMTCLCN